MTVRVLRVDGDVAFLDKPSGMLVHSSAWAGPREHALVDEARVVLGDGWHPLHRLDRQTSGVVAFARGADTIARVQAAMERGDVDKRYWALVRGHLRGPVDVDHAIKDDDTGAVRAARSRVEPLLLSEVDRCSLVEVRLFTGRRHQARRHLKHIAHPVIGDATHGKGPLNRAYREAYGLARMALHARSLALEDHRVTAPLPDDLVVPLVRLFGHALDALHVR